MNEPLKRRLKERRSTHAFREAKQTDFEDSANGLAGEEGLRDVARRNAVRQAAQGGRTWQTFGLRPRNLTVGLSVRLDLKPWPQRTQRTQRAAEPKGVFLCDLCVLCG